MKESKAIDEPSTILLSTIEGSVQPKEWRQFDKMDIDPSAFPIPTDVYSSLYKWDYISARIGGTQVLIALLKAMVEEAKSYSVSQVGKENHCILMKTLSNKDGVYAMVVVRLSFTTNGINGETFFL